MRCIRSVRFIILVNGILIPSFTPSRDIRQGDLLSPYLFIICTEGLFVIIRYAERQALFSSLRFNVDCPSISHLFFY